jgi:four helix bundle protein
MFNSNIQNKSLKFARNIHQLCKRLEQKREFIISNQLLKSGTSVGANLREGYFAESRSDFIHKLSISLKEINESLYWLELLFLEKIIEDSEFEILNNQGTEILKILIVIIKKLKNTPLKP